MGCANIYYAPHNVNNMSCITTPPSRNLRKVAGR